MGQVLRTLLRQVLEERGLSLAEVGRRLGKSRSWLPNALDPENENSLRSDQVSEILATAGVPLLYFYNRYIAILAEYPQAPVRDADPTSVFASLTSESSEDLAPEDDLAPELACVLLDTELMPLVAERFEALPMWLLHLDTLRLNDPKRAFRHCLSEIRRRYEAVKLVRADSQRRAALVLALAATASAARTNGRSKLAGLVLSHAFRLLGTARAGFLAGDLLWRSGIILIDHGLLSLGISMVERSVSHFNQFRTPAGAFAASRASVSLGSFYVVRGDFAAAKRCYHSIINEEHSGDLQRAYGIVNLAWLYDRLDEPAEALALLERVEALATQMPRRSRIETRWVRARALCSLKCYGEAQVLYQELVGPVEDVGEPTDPIILCADFAAALRPSDDLQLLERAQAAARRAHEKIKSLPLAHAASAKLLAALSKTMIDSDEIVRLRHLFESATARR